MKKEELIKSGRRAGNSDFHLLKEIMTDKLNTTQMKLLPLMNQIINERTKYKSLIFNHILQESIILEDGTDSENREDVLQKISNGEVG